MIELRRQYFKLTDEDLFNLCDQVSVYTDDSFRRVFPSFQYQTVNGTLHIQKHTQESLIEQLVSQTRYRAKRKKDRRIQSPVNWSAQTGSRCYIGNS